MNRLSIFVAAALAASAPAHAETIISGSVRVLDGDTVAMGVVRIRLHGIDAPEDGQTCQLTDGTEWDCGKAATDRLVEVIADRSLECSPVDRDRYGRIVADCFAEGINIGEALVRSGLAWAYRRYSLDYVPSETAAKAARRGVWQSPSIAPWDWRKQRDAGG
ncbi:thermonuclease family protein [Brucella grignonensis]|uniref:TNase-like domain-containing protein n=1 Tax=Brucella grignonensis TaxID=94627 RepID=A0A256FEN9_9HYPH|nr:thermonuclease family protein [Brucella grignonensis]OYR13319.1 hypothetical protein CEV33_1044 [Brucella grignonensis]